MARFLAIGTGFSRCLLEWLSNIQDVKARFIEPMECLSVQRLPLIAGWTYEIKLDGYRMQAVRLPDSVVFYSRRGNELKFPEIAKELGYLPPETVIDGELAALDDQGFPRFNLLQNYRSDSAHLTYFAFDILVHKGRDVTRLSLSERRTLLQSSIKRGDYSEVAQWTTDLEGIESFVRKHKLEGIIAKREDSRYESSKRSGMWVKMRRSNRRSL
jgi:bifunctional non-homologous end joining protein LigD